MRAPVLVTVATTEVADRGNDRGERSYGPRPGGFNDRNSGGGFGGRTKNASEGGWGGRPQRDEQRGFDNRDNRGAEQGSPFEQRGDSRGFGAPRQDPRGFDNRENRGFDNRNADRGGDRNFVPRAPFGADRAPVRSQDNRGFEPRGDQRQDARSEPRPFQRPERTSTWAPRPGDDKRPAKKPFSPGKTGASSFGKTSKPKIVKVIGR